jgi:hypothetical protein
VIVRHPDIDVRLAGATEPSTSINAMLRLLWSDGEERGGCQAGWRGKCLVATAFHPRNHSVIASVPIPTENG